MRVKHTNMVEIHQVPLQLISEIANRELSFVRFLAMKLDYKIQNGHVSIENGLMLTKTLSARAIETKELIELREENQKIAQDRQSHALAVEFLKSERKALKEKVDRLEYFLKQSDDRTNRFEASLLKMAESVSHLANNRDALMGQMLEQSSWDIKKVGQKEVLILSNPISE